MAAPEQREERRIFAGRDAHRHPPHWIGPLVHEAQPVAPLIHEADDRMFGNCAGIAAGRRKPERPAIATRCGAPVLERSGQVLWSARAERDRHHTRARCGVERAGRERCRRGLRRWIVGCNGVWRDSAAAGRNDQERHDNPPHRSKLCSAHERGDRVAARNYYKVATRLSRERERVASRAGTSSSPTPSPRTAGRSRSG